MHDGTGYAVPGRLADGACAEMLQTRPLRQSVCWNDQGFQQRCHCSQESLYHSSYLSATGRVLAIGQLTIYWVQVPYDERHLCYSECACIQSYP